MSLFLNFSYHNAISYILFLINDLTYYSNKYLIQRNICNKWKLYDW